MQVTTKSGAKNREKSGEKSEKVDVVRCKDLRWLSVGTGAVEQRNGEV